METTGTEVGGDGSGGYVSADAGRPHLIIILEGARASTGLCVDVSSGVMI